MNHPLRSLWPSIMLVLFALPVEARSSDLEREERLASEIVDTILDGEPVWLDAGGHRFLGISMRSEVEPARGAAIVLHGRGYHPNWPDVVYPVRTGLPRSGWDTLSIQMPVLEKDATYYDYLPVLDEAGPRIEAAIAYLKRRGAERIVLIAHSCGVHMSMRWLERTAAPAIDAYVGVGMGATDYRQYMKAPFPLERLRFPVLDIYGADEYPGVIKMAPERLALMRKAGNRHSAQRVVVDANHYFTDRGEPLLDAIVAWLNTLDR